MVECSKLEWGEVEPSRAHESIVNGSGVKYSQAEPSRAVKGVVDSSKAM